MTTQQDEESLSILSLYMYTRNINYAKQLHLVFCMENYPELLLDGINLILKAQSMQNQYFLMNSIKTVAEDFGNIEIDVMSVRDLELIIEEKTEHIMAMDIALLKFIASVPEIIEENSFKLPGNVSVDYLVGEYLSVGEHRIVTRLAKTFDLYTSADACSRFETVTPPFNGRTIQYSNDENIRKIKRERDLQSSDDEEVDIDIYHRKFLKFYKKFIDTGRAHSSLDLVHTVDSNKLSQLLSTLELRQLLFAMSTTFSGVSTHAKLIDIFIDANITDRDESVKAAKRQNIIANMSVEECRTYASDFMISVVFFMTVEANNNNTDDILPDRRNQLLLVLVRMLDHLLEYIDFKANQETCNKILYSKLPIVDDDSLDSQTKPITATINMIQYALNFATFISNAI